MISVEEALDIVLEHSQTLHQEKVELKGKDLTN
jgi:molybdopterin biosynthesis enzyme